MKNNIFKNLLIMVPMLVAFTGCGDEDSNSSQSSVVQIERLARPAINEGLVLSNDNLNAFNSIPPSSDLDSANPAVADVLAEATVVLNVVTALGMTAGATPPAVNTIVGQFLPDVMRISVDDTHIGGLLALDARTGNQNLNQVGYTSCLGGAGAPLLCGGRKIRDDVIDITLSYIAAGGAGAGLTGTATAPPVYAIRDQITYSTTHTTNLLATFPFLAAPL
ncbi:MAG TPA: DUF4331 family protein [Bacteriovoracaceae bacterium]|nr:DUF4331 family protein [Bacteriovoracaceae bacterium]